MKLERFPYDESRRRFLIALGLLSFTCTTGAAWPIINRYIHQEQRREWIESAMSAEAQRFRRLLASPGALPVQEKSLLSSWQPTEQFTAPEVLPFPVPVFHSLPENTVCLYLPGAGEIRPEQSMGEMLEYYHRFLLSKGTGPEQAVHQIQQFAGNIKNIQSEPDQEKRLAGQLKIMAEHGLYCLPWELFSEDKRTPLSMACAAGGFIQTLPPSTPVILMGMSFGGFAQRVIYKMLQAGDLDRIIGAQRIIGGVSISEGYYGDILGLILSLNQPALNRLIQTNDRLTGRGVLQLLKNLRDSIGQKSKEAERIAEELIQRNLSFTAPDQILKALDDFLLTFGKEPETIGQIVRLTAKSMVDPELVAGVNAESLGRKGCTPVLIRAEADIHALTAGIPGARQLQISHNPNGKIDKVTLQYCQSNLPESIPPFLLSEAHAKYPQAASLVFG